MYCTRLTVSQSNELLYAGLTQMQWGARACKTTEGRTVMCHSKDTSGRLGSFSNTTKVYSLATEIHFSFRICGIQPVVALAWAFATSETAYDRALGNKSLVEEKAISVNQLFKMNIPSMIFIILRISQKSGVLSACTDSELVPGHRGGVAWGRGVEVYCCNLHMDM